MTTMTPEQLRAECARLAALAAKATPGKWAVAWRTTVLWDGGETVCKRRDAEDNAALFASAPDAYAVAAQVPALLDRIAELERDAARYRWLRDCGRKHFTPASSITEQCGQGPFIMQFLPGVHLVRVSLSGAHADAAIDAAMQAQTKESGK
jgi:hypothetical protein